MKKEGDLERFLRSLVFAALPRRSSRYVQCWPRSSCAWAAADWGWGALGAAWGVVDASAGECSSESSFLPPPRRKTTVNQRGKSRFFVKYEPQVEEASCWRCWSALVGWFPTHCRGRTGGWSSSGWRTSAIVCPGRWPGFGGTCPRATRRPPAAASALLRRRRCSATCRKGCAPYSTCSLSARCSWKFITITEKNR